MSWHVAAGTNQDVATTNHGKIHRNPLQLASRDVLRMPNSETKSIPSFY